MDDLTRRVVAWAKRAVAAEDGTTLEPRHFFVAVAADPDIAAALGAGAGTPLSFPPEIEALARRAGTVAVPERKVPMSPAVKAVFGGLYRRHRGDVPAVALLLGLLALPDDPVMAEIRERNPSLAEALVASRKDVSGVDEVMARVLAVQNMLARKVVGQAAAVQQIADAIFQAQISAPADGGAPRVVLLFLGPPGVGKTYTAQLLADALDTGAGGGYLRLDMSAYADFEGFRGLVGFEPSYHGARPGVLTSFAREHPRGLILIDEVEKSGRSVQNLLLQLLDYGVLQDKFTQEKVAFTENTIVITTNLGRELYGSSLGQSAGAEDGASRSAVLEALAGAVIPGTTQSVLAPELVSRLAKGYPILFDHLTPAALEEIARLALDEVAAEMEARLGLRMAPVDDRMLTLLIQRLGPDLDARKLTSGVPLAIKDALRAVLSEYRDELFGEHGTWERVRNLVLDLPRGPGRELFQSMEEGGERFLVVGAGLDHAALGGRFPELAWSFAEPAEAGEVLRRSAPDVVLVDIARGDDASGPGGLGPVAKTLREIRRARPGVPLVLFSSAPPANPAEERARDRLVRTSGARAWLPGAPESWEPGPGGTLDTVRRSVLRERYLREAFRARKTASFQWEVDLAFDGKEGTLTLRPMDLHTRTVVASKDRSARLTFTGIPAERFADVAGAGEAKRRLAEVLAWMRDPEALRRLGIRLPSGILLEGPPGNGKTLLARATAGEAGLPFFAVSATDFASKWVGESESNIRELFERAATYAPSILFIDEIDAIGARRGETASSHHDSMLNQLLVSMDGFSGRDRPVFYLAATNRADMLDPALKRPGRFDLVVTVDDLDAGARLELLRIKTARLPLAGDVDLETLARSAMGLSGAQLARVVQEAAILALRGASGGQEEILVDMALFREALTNVRYGLRQEGALPPETELRRTAYHEAGHALVGELERPGSVHQATILPRGRALGFVESLPESEFAALTASAVRSRIRTALAGRAAEILVYGPEEVSAGCSQDLAMATQIAALAVSRYGMSQAVGPVSVPALEALLRGAASGDAVRREVEAMLRREEAAVQEQLEENRRALEAIAALLLERETVPGAAIREALGRMDPGGAGGA